MVGVFFNDLHSFYDLGFGLTSKKIESPSVKSKTVTIEGGDGVIDLTDYFGEPKYNNRTLTFNFVKVENQSTFIETWSSVQNEFNGQKVNITLDEEPEFYYIGRITTSYTRSKNITTYTFKCDCDPYKLKHTKTIVTVDGSSKIDLYNLRKKVVPTVTTTADARLTFGSFVSNVSSGTFVIPELELKSGNNEVTVESLGTTTFEYQEGGL